MERKDVLIRIVDDDEAMRDAMLFLLEGEGFRTASFGSAEEYLAKDDPTVPGCLLLDVKMTGMSGLELQDYMRKAESAMPIVFLSAHGNIDMAVDAMHRGAVSFLTKPVRTERLLAALDKALSSIPGPPVFGAEAPKVELSQRETQVVKYVAAGLTNRAIAEALGISKRTVEFFRASAMRKLGARNAADLVKRFEALTKGGRG